MLYRYITVEMLCRVRTTPPVRLRHDRHGIAAPMKRCPDPLLTGATMRLGVAVLAATALWLGYIWVTR
jgi:hypothetical protein